jgi:CheY-like chemotaxis protein
MTLSEGASSDFAAQLVHVDRLSAALSSLAQASFDALLLDLSLPDAQGVDTLRRVRQVAPALPIVVLTGLDDDTVALSAMRNGAQDYLVKGQVTANLLVRSIRYAIERKKSEAPAEKDQKQLPPRAEGDVDVPLALDLAKAVELFLQKAANVCPNMGITVCLRNPDSGTLERFACRNIDENSWKQGAPSMGDGHSGAALAEGKAVLMTDAAADPRTTDRDFLRRNGLVSYAGVPLIVEGEALGVMGFYARELRSFHRDEMEIFNLLARQIAFTILNSRL